MDNYLNFNPRYGYTGHEQQYLLNVGSSQATSPTPSTYDVGLVSDSNSQRTRVYPSPVSSLRDTASPQPTLGDNHEDGSFETILDETEDLAAGKSETATKKKRENRYKNAPPSVLSRRRAQNRASQRAYRERKDQRIKDLEAMLSEQKQKTDTLSQAYSGLCAEYLKLSGTVYEPARTHTYQQRSDPSYNSIDMSNMELNSGLVDYGSNDDLFIYHSTAQQQSSYRLQ